MRNLRKGLVVAALVAGFLADSLGQPPVSYGDANLPHPGAPLFAAPNAGFTSGQASNCPEVTTFPGGPSPSAAYPVAVATDPTHGRVYAVHRGLIGDVMLNDGSVAPTDRVSVVDADTGRILATIPVGRSLSGSGQGIAVDPRRNRVFVGNADEKSVSIIDSLTNTVISTTTISGAVQNIAADADTGLVYVAAGDLVVLNAATGAVAATIAMPNKRAWAVAVDSSTHLAYVRDKNTIVAVNGQTGAILGQAQIGELIYTLHRIAVDPGSRLYAADFNSGRIVVYDISDGGGALKPAPNLSAGMYVDSLAVDPITHRLFVADSAHDQVQVFDQSGNKLKTVGMPNGTWAIETDPIGRRAYVGRLYTGSLGVIDLDKLTTGAPIPLGTFNPAVAYDASAGRLYTANFLADSVAVVDAKSHALLANWPVEGRRPWAIAVDPALRQVYSLNLTAKEGSLTILSTVDGQVKGKVDVGAQASGGRVVVSPTSHRVYVTAGHGLTVLDGTTHQILATVETGDPSIGVDFDEAADRAFVAFTPPYAASDAIKVIDLKTFQVIATWPTQPDLKGNWDLAVDPALHRLFVTFGSVLIGGPNGLKVLNSDTGAFIARPPVTAGSGLAGWVTVDRRTHRVFVTDPDTGMLSIVDGASGTVISQVKAGAYGLSVDPESGRVYVANASDGTISAVTPCPAAMAAPQPEQPANGATLASMTATLSWTNPPGATQYHLQVTPANGDGPAINLIVGDPSAVALSSYTVPRPVAGMGNYILLPGMSYAWRVRITSKTSFAPEDDASWGPWSDSRAFRTPTPTGAGLTAVSPSNDATVPSDARQTLQWRHSDDALFYWEIQVSGDERLDADPQTATSFVWWNLVHGGVTVPHNSWTTPRLQAGSAYYWRVRPRVQGDGAPVAWGPTWSFKTP